MSPGPLSRGQTSLNPHSQSEEEVKMAIKARKKKTINRCSRRQRQWIRKRCRCSPSIKRTSLLHPSAAGGAHLPFHSRTTSASTLLSGDRSKLFFCFFLQKRRKCCGQIMSLFVCVSRFEFRTVHKQDFPRWSSLNPGCTIRLRTTVPNKVNSASGF